MPIWEKTYLKQAESLDDSGAKKFDLPKKGFLSSLMVNLRVQNDSDYCRNNQVWEHLDKIEVLHRGTEVIKSLKYCEPHGLNVLDSGEMPRGRRRESSSYWQWENFFLNFGRYPGDLEYGLDLEKLVDPKFSLEWDLDLSTDGTADQFETDTLELNLIPIMLREGPPAGLKGYIKSSEIDQWTGAHDVTHTTEIPRGNDVRRIVVRSFLYGYEIYMGCWYTELDLDTGTRVPFKMYGKNWLDLDSVLNKYKGLVHNCKAEVGKSPATTSFGVNTNFGKLEAYGVSVMTAGRVASNAVVTGNAVSGMVCDSSGTPQTSGQAYLLMSGIAPYNCLTIPFDKPSMDYNLKTMDYSDIDLKIKSHYEYLSGEELQDIRVVLEEVIKA